MADRSGPGGGREELLDITAKNALLEIVYLPPTRLASGPRVGLFFVDPSDNPFWHHFWTAKLASMGRLGIKVFSRPLRYRNQTVKLPDGSTYSFLVGQEKGVDIRIALDTVQAVRLRECEVILVFSL